MHRISIYPIFLAIFAIAVWTVEGARIPHRSFFTSHESAVEENPTSTIGLCYKTVWKTYKSNAPDGSPNNTTRSRSEYTATQYDSGEWITILDCCTDYQRNIITDKCDPQCRRGCVGGQCIRPNVCVCPPDKHLEEGICVSNCNRPCEKDAFCLSEEVCICKFGYEKVQDECRPVCLGGCENGDCVAPDVCRCNVGYVLKYRHECVPACEGGCPHGVCTSPGICTCNDGYANPAGEQESCVPHCPDGCSGGECISPGICNCTTGYTRDQEGRCRPSTLESQSGLSCQSGWRLEEGMCVPICNRPCQKDAYCFAPEVCVCKFGYKEDQGQCRPVCLSGCENGECVAPRMCRCSPGYVLKYGRKCVPVCEGGCPHGVCTAPGICRCNYGYVNPAGVQGSCVPHCPDGCIGGECTSPEICNCRPGYTRDQEGRCRPSTLESQSNLTCQSGWRLEEGMCVPICNRPCQKDAYCFAPEVCVCKFGYKEDKGQCRPVCLNDCENGECVAPRKCRCNLGYVLKYRHKCVPVCEGGCPHGVCTAPGICTCNDGYVNPAGEQESCIPHCPNGCNGGACIAPGICNCRPGYIHDSQGGCSPSAPNNHSDPSCQSGWRLEEGMCVPICNRPCQKDAYCSAPETCVCKFGYKEDKGQCRPVCLNDCENGECVAPRKCRCNIGYVSKNRHECVPVCGGGCPHGVCTAPGICTCNDGYVNPAGEQESCVPHCADGCNGGECISLGICNCTTGYARDPQGGCSPTTPKNQSGLSCQAGWRLEEDMCVPVCSRPCQKDAYCSVPELCVCKFGYEEVGGFCQPSCPDGCKNGNCIAPRVCACRPGYVLNDNNECVALCNDGQLTAPGICTCYDGYVNPPWERGACVPYCASGCIGGECISPGLCKY